MPAWPSSLPQELLLGNLTYQHGDPTVRSSVEAGQDKVRRRYSVAPDEVSGQMYLTDAQRATLRDFYRNTTQGGALRFDWKDPFDGTTNEFRFTSPPDIRPLASDLFVTRLTFEVLV